MISRSYSYILDGTNIVYEKQQTVAQGGGDIGIGEDRLRSLIAEGKTPSLKIGNRHYIAMELFSQDYSSCLTDIETTSNEDKENADGYVRREINKVLKNGSRTIEFRRR